MQWEYEVIWIADINDPFEPDKVKEELDGYGHQGWELVTITVFGTSLRAFFKRPIAGGTTP